MIHLSSVNIDELEASLVDHDETIKLESDVADLRIFLSPAQAWGLMKSLERCMRGVELDYMGLYDELKPIYAEIEEFRKVTA